MVLRLNTAGNFYFYAMNQSENALQSSQSDEVFNLLKRSPTDMYHTAQLRLIGLF